MTADIGYSWRGPLGDREVYELTSAHDGQAESGWWDRVKIHSLGWVCARGDAGDLLGFVNVAWDGSDHAFLLDPKVRPDHQHRGIATHMVKLAATRARDAGCVWLHVDFRANLRPFYIDACGFAPTDAGILRLASEPADG